MKIQTNIGLLNDHILFRSVLKKYINEIETIHVRVEAHDVKDLLLKLDQTPVEILLMDVELPGLSGTAAVKAIREAYPEIKIIVVSIHADRSLIRDLLELGINAYITKADYPADLTNAIQAAIENRIYRNKFITEALYDLQENELVKIKKKNVPLDEREKKLIQMLWEESTNKEIAQHLYLSVRSIEKIRQEIKAKLGIKSTIGLFKYAIKEKIISPHSNFAEKKISEKTE